jgi:hypothetical protein
MMNSVDFVTQLNGLYARNESQKYPIPMAKIIVKYFKSYSPDMLVRLLELICNEWTSSFGPPVLGEIRKIIKSYNDIVPNDRAIGPPRPKQLPDNTEGCVSRKTVAAFYGAMGKIIKIRDKKARKALFKAEAERILHGKDGN